MILFENRNPKTKDNRIRIRYKRICVFAFLVVDFIFPFFTMKKKTILFNTVREENIFR